MSNDKSKRYYAVYQLSNDMLLGGTIGAITKTIMAPIERVKVLMQVTNSHPDVLSGKSPPFKNMFDCATKVFKTQGIISFWRGNVINCLRYAPQQGSALALNDFFEQCVPCVQQQH